MWDWRCSKFPALHCTNPYAVENPNPVHRNFCRRAEPDVAGQYCLCASEPGSEESKEPFLRQCICSGFDFALEGALKWKLAMSRLGYVDSSKQIISIRQQEQEKAAVPIRAKATG